MANELLDWADKQTRLNDPETSRIAAKKIAKNLTGLHLTFLRVLKELGKATANEVAEAASDNFARRNTIRRRASDLVAQGKIRVVGTRACKISGRQASVYEVVE
jgi:predicted HTH transcriptional regulator